MSSDFPETSWTLIRQACEGHTGGRRALEEFSDRYYEPVRAFFGALFRDSREDAADHTQAFFTSKILSRQVLSAARPESGTFRQFLKQCLRYYAHDVFRKRKRTVAKEVSLEAGEKPMEFAAKNLWPKVDVAFHEAWVRSLLQQAFDQVADHCQARGQREHFALFAARFLAPTNRVPSWSELGSSYGIDQKKARSRADTVLRQLRRIIMDLLTESAGSRAAAEEELDALLSLLGDAR